MHRLVTCEAVGFSPEERAHYEELAEQEAGGEGYVYVLAKLLRLRMACIHPRLQELRAELQLEEEMATPEEQGLWAGGGHGLPYMHAEAALAHAEGQPHDDEVCLPPQFPCSCLIATCQSSAASSQ